MVKERRKSKKIEHPKVKPPRIDDDLTELATVLDEYRLDNNSRGWFHPAWRNGWNAVALAWACWKDATRMEREGINKEHPSQIQRDIGEFLDDAITRRVPSAEAYWRINEFLQACTTDEKLSSRHLYAALRCMQVLISNSSGGGEVYNMILKLAFEPIYESVEIADLVLEHRCMDAINSTAKLQNDRFDRQRRAFSIAWRRGLYLAAYSISPIFNFGTLIIHKDSN